MKDLSEAITKILADAEEKQRQENGPIRTVIYYFFARVDCNLRKSADHLWLQTCPSIWSPDSTLMGITSIALFDTALERNLLRPDDNSIVFAIEDNHNIAVSQTSHYNFPPRRIAKKKLVQHWRKLVSTPLLSPGRICTIRVNIETQEIVSVVNSTMEPPRFLQFAIKTAGTVRVNIGRHTLHASIKPYGNLDKQAQKEAGVRIFNTFMEHFYATPILLSHLWKLRNSKAPERLLVQCNFDDRQPFDQQKYFVMPLVESSIWNMLNASAATDLEENKLFLWVTFQGAFPSHSRVVSIEEDVDPLPEMAPFTDYTVQFQEHPERICGQCKKKAEFMGHCPTCKLVRYCSRECQVKHYRAGHERLCPLFTSVRESFTAGAGEALPKSKH